MPHQVLHGTDLAVRLKSMRGRGGGIEDVLYQVSFRAVMDFDIHGGKVANLTWIVRHSDLCAPFCSGFRTSQDLWNRQCSSRSTITLALQPTAPPPRKSGEFG